ncbi:MAG: hypothetical protein ABJL67_07890 [Sulfitobacter sp.]
MMLQARFDLFGGGTRNTDAIRALNASDNAARRFTSAVYRRLQRWYATLRNRQLTGWNYARDVKNNAKTAPEEEAHNLIL